MILPMIFSGFRSLLSWSNCISEVTFQVILSPDLLKAYVILSFKLQDDWLSRPLPLGGKVGHRHQDRDEKRQRKVVAQKQRRARDQVLETARARNED